MSKLYGISVAHMEPDVVAMSLARFARGAGMKPNAYVVVSHHWPIRPEGFHDLICKAAGLVEGIVVQPEKNLGGHGGFNFALKHIVLKPDDLVIGYDPDSFPITENWLKAMVEVMRADPTLGYLSLMPEWVQTHRDWNIETHAGHRVAFHPVTEMFNVTIWRGSMLDGGLQAPLENAFYGNVESAMKEVAQRKGLRHGYLRDFLEIPCPIHPHPLYVDWKVAAGMHRSYRGNFDQFVKERGL